MCGTSEVWLSRWRARAGRGAVCLSLAVALSLAWACGAARADDAALLTPFQQSLLGSSVIAGFSRTYPQLVLLNKDATSDPVKEQYRGNDAVTPSASLWLLPGENLFGSSAPPEPGWPFRTYATLGGGFDYDGFAGRQALLRLSDGSVGRGTIHGSHVLATLKLLAWVSWENSVLPMAWGVSEGLGLEFFQFSGSLQYQGGSGDQQATVSSNGTHMTMALPFELYWQFGRYVRLRWMFTDTVIALPQDASLKQGGQSLGHYQYDHRLSVYTLGYVWSF